MVFKNTKAFSSFSVKDLDETRKFYGQTLGLGVSESDEGLSLQTQGSNDVFIYPKTDHIPATFTVLNFVVDDVDKKVDELTKMGIRFEIYDKGDLKTDDRGVFQGKPKIAWFKDPSGNFLSILENGS
ncbi:MAG TPA: VOC family protein [Nitrososphaeraceae archaeon]|jgi:catechol 2,3-dioxygenase-like lactoylglutathione lyase family enzyme